MTPVFLPRYPEPRKVPTNPHWCPYAKGSPYEGQALPPVYGGGRDTNAVGTVSQDSHPTQYNYNGSRKSRGVVWFF
jgi:hypothetical protein